MVQLFTLAYSKICAEYSCLFIKVINFLYLRFDALTELGAFMRTEFIPAPLRPPVVYSTDRSKAVAPVLFLLFVALWFISRDDLFDVLSCVIFYAFQSF